MQKQYDMVISASRTPERRSRTCRPHRSPGTSDFVDWFSICGPVEKCTARLRTIIDLAAWITLLPARQFLQTVAHPSWRTAAAGHGGCSPATVRRTGAFREVSNKKAPLLRGFFSTRQLSCCRTIQRSSWHTNTIHFKHACLSSANDLRSIGVPIVTSTRSMVVAIHRSPTVCSTTAGRFGWRVSHH